MFFVALDGNVNVNGVDTDGVQNNRYAVDTNPIDRYLNRQGTLKYNGDITVNSNLSNNRPSVFNCIINEDGNDKSDLKNNV